jgi:aminomethyltransferase
LPADDAEKIARALLADPDVLPIGLGARDSLRLEAGLCLYGHDIDETIDPPEANLVWAIGKRRKLEKGFPAADNIMDRVVNGTARKRVGIRPDGRAPARDGTEIADKTGRIIGKITSGGFGPSLNAPIAMGYVETEVRRRRHRSRSSGPRQSLAGAHRPDAVRPPPLQTRSSHE